MRGELPVAADGILVRPVPCVGVDDTGPALDIRNNDPARLNKVVADEASDSDHVGSKAVPDIRSGGFEDGFEISAQRAIEIGARAPRVGGVEHPTEADVVLLVVKNRSGRTQTAGGEHGASHKFQSDAIFDKDFGNRIVGIGHGGEASRGIGGGENLFRHGGGAALLHLGKKRERRCE